MESRSPWVVTATGPVVRMQPDSASAVMITVIGIRNARTTRTGAIPQSETTPVLHRVWLINGILHARTEDRTPSLRARGTRVRKSSGRDADADRARHAGTAQTAIARRVLGEVLLMIVLG